LKIWRVSAQGHRFTRRMSVFGSVMRTDEQEDNECAGRRGQLTTWPPEAATDQPSYGATQIMNSSAVPTASRTAPIYPVRFIAGAVVLTLAAAVMASTFSLSKRDVSGDENAVTHCERLAQSSADRMVSAGMENDTADFRRQRFSAFAACLDNPDAFEHRLNPSDHGAD
jgi:hypothetical protein